MDEQIEIPGWRFTTTGWNEDGDAFRRNFILTRGSERHPESYTGDKDDAAFWDFVKNRAGSFGPNPLVILDPANP